MKKLHYVLPLLLIGIAGCAGPAEKVDSGMAGKITYLEEWNWRQERQIEQLRQEVTALKGEYLLAPGDTFTKVANRFGITVEALKALNPDADPAKLRVGQALKIK